MRQEDPAPLVSVITVCYNAEEHIESCILSVKNQPFREVEHVIIDGKSTDRTLSILKKYDEDIFWRSEEDSGIYHAMNKAVHYARGKWFIFLGADDRLLPGFFDMALQLSEPEGIYYGNYLMNGQELGGERDAYFLVKNNICHQSILYPRSVFDKYSYEEKYRVCADHYLTIQCWLDKQFRFIYHNIPIAEFSSEGFSSVEKDPLFEQDRTKLIKKYFGAWIYARYRFRQMKDWLKAFSV